jgi:Mlc titration factor MtfA (ptsG expression regulator)
MDKYGVTNPAEFFAVAAETISAVDSCAHPC